MKAEDKRKLQERKNTPVSDGDTRPDQQPHNTWPLSNEMRKNFTEERGADVNSLEDFKDSAGTRRKSDRSDDADNTSPVPFKHDEENE